MAASFARKKPIRFTTTTTRGTSRRFAQELDARYPESASGRPQRDAQIQQPGSRHDDGDVVRGKYSGRRQALRSLAGERRRGISRSRRAPAEETRWERLFVLCRCELQLRLNSRPKANCLAAVPRSYLFRDRADAGRQLAENLLSYAGRDDVIVLVIPRGGVTVTLEVAPRRSARCFRCAQARRARARTRHGRNRIRWHMRLNEDVVYALPDAQSIVGDGHCNRTRGIETPGTYLSCRAAAVGIYVGEL